MSRHPAEGGSVEQVAALLDDGLDVDDIAATLAMSEAEVGRIARALAEQRVPAPRNPLEDRAPETAAEPDLEEDEAPRPPPRAQVKVAALVIEHSTSGTDLDDLAGVLGVTNALEPAERWRSAVAICRCTVVRPRTLEEPAVWEHAQDCPVHPAKHVHDVGPAWEPSGDAYALCASCGARWDRASCDMCGLPVTALVIAESGLRRHRHHRTEVNA